MHGNFVKRTLAFSYVLKIENESFTMKPSGKNEAPQVRPCTEILFNFIYINMRISQYFREIQVELHFMSYLDIELNTFYTLLNMSRC